MIKKLLQALLAVITCCSGSTLILADENKTLEVEVTFDSSDRQAVRTFDVNRVSPGEFVEVIVQFQNESTEIIQFENVNLSCGCMQCKASQQALEPGDATPVYFQIKAPSQPTTKSYVLQARIDFRNSNRNVTMQFRLNFVNLLAFEKDKYTQEFVVEDQLLSSFGSFRIPMLVSSDQDPAKYQVRANEGLSPAKFKIENTQGQWFLVGSYRNVDLDKMPITGGVTVSSEATKLDASTVIELVGIRRYSFFPDLLRLREEEAGGSYSGSLVLRRRGLINEQLALDQIRCETSGGTKIRTQVTEVKDGFYRASFEVDSNDADPLRAAGNLMVYIPDSEPRKIPVQFL